MPYKDIDKQREAVRKSVAKLRAKNKGITSNTRKAVIPKTEPSICLTCSDYFELKKTYENTKKQLDKLQTEQTHKLEKKRQQWREQKKRQRQKGKLTKTKKKN